MNRNIFFCIALSCGLFGTSSAQFYQYNDPKIEARLDSLLKTLSQPEKMLYLEGYKNGYIRAMPRLGLPEVRFIDQKQLFAEPSQAENYISPLAIAATWDTTMALKAGKCVGIAMPHKREMYVWNGINANPYRSPLSPNNSETFGEEPFVCGKMAAYFAKGIHSQGFLAALNHFVADYDEYSQAGLNVNIEERTIEEMYITPYRIAISEAKMGVLEAGKGSINGVSIAESGELLTDVLKGECLYEGFVIGNQTSVKNGFSAAQAGIDWVKNSHTWQKDSLVSASKNGKIAEGLLNDKVRRIMRVLMYQQAKKIATKTANDSIPPNVLEIYKNSVVLLKNDKNLLPFDPAQVKSIALFDPPTYADMSKQSLMLSLEKQYPTATITASAAAGKWAEWDKPEWAFYGDSTFNDAGLRMELFDNPNLEGMATLNGTDTKIGGSWDANTPPFSKRWQGVFEVSQAETYTFAIAGDDGFRVFVDGELLIDAWKENSNKIYTASKRFEAESLHHLKVEYFHKNGLARLRFGFRATGEQMAAAKELAKNIQYPIFFLGYEREDEKAFRVWDLPPLQLEMLKSVAEINPNTIVVLTASGSVPTEEWLNKVPCVLYMPATGEQASTVLADIFSGKHNPSGKMPFTFDKKLEDNATFSSMFDTDNDGKITFSEGIYTGYRHYQRQGNMPLFALGYGLSYTTFATGGLMLNSTNYNGYGTFRVSCAVSNTGKVAGSELVQVFLRDNNSALLRPQRELKGFAKVSLKPGETKTVNIELSPDAFAYYNAERKKWVAENGVFEVQIGNNAHDYDGKMMMVYTGEQKVKRKRKWFGRKE